MTVPAHPPDDGDRSKMRKFLALLVAGALLSACGGDGGGGTEARKGPVSQQQVEQILLDVAELPPGYTAAAEGQVADGVFCSGLQKLREDVGKGVAADVAFTGPDQISTVGQQAYYDPTARYGVGFVRRIFAKCANVKAVVQGQEVTFHVSEQPFKKYGDESTAYRVSGQVMGVPFGADFVAVKRGDVVNLVYVAGIGADHTEQLEQLVDVTYAKQEKVTG